MFRQKIQKKIISQFNFVRFLVSKNIRILFIIILILFFISCNKNNSQKHSYYNSKLKLQYKLIQSDSLIFTNRDSILIGVIGSVYIWRDYILAQDLINCNFHIFNLNLKYLSTIGAKGRGPGEYTIPPIIVECEDSSKLYLLDVQYRKLNEYNSNFELKFEHHLPNNFYYSPYPAVKINNKYIFSAAFPYPINNDEYFKKYKALIQIDENYEYQKNFFNWDKIYFDPTYSAYARNSFSVNLTNGKTEEFYAQQQASFIIHRFDKNLKLIKSFGVLPKHFKDPPADIGPDQTQKNLESFYDFLTKISSFRNIDYDREKIFVTYKSSTKKGLYEKNNLLALYYLQIYDNNYDCIYDDRLPGRFLFSKNDNVYILTDETQNFFKIKIYKLEKSDEEI